MRPRSIKNRGSKFDNYRDLINRPFKGLPRHRQKVKKPDNTLYPVTVANRRFDARRNCNVVDITYVGYGKARETRPVADIVELGGILCIYLWHCVLFLVCNRAPVQPQLRTFASTVSVCSFIAARLHGREGGVTRPGKVCSFAQPLLFCILSAAP